MPKSYTFKELEYKARYDKAMECLEKNRIFSLGHLIENLSIEKPAKPALYFENSCWTWEEFNSECNRYANFFKNIGLDHQDRIAIMSENCPDYLFITMGINKIQGVTALINVNQRKEALIHAFSVADPKYIIIDGENLPHFMDIYNRLTITMDKIFILNNNDRFPHKFEEIDNIIKNCSHNNPKTTKNSTIEDTILYIYTSGTTGLPKAVVTKNNTFYSGVLGHSIVKLNSSDITYITTPLYHSLGISTLWSSVVFTQSSAVLRRKFSASNFWKDIHKYRVSYTGVLGEIPRYLLNQPVSELEKAHTLKKVLSLGLRKIIWDKFKSRFQIEHIYEVYGSTEGYGPLINVDEIPGMVGRFDPEVHILLKVNPETEEFIQGKDGKYQKCISGDIGMLLNLIEDPELFDLYSDSAATNRKILRNVLKDDDDAYLMTGDLFLLHEDRWLSFADRLGDTFRWKGENVSTQEVESMINFHQSITSCAVYGVSIPDSDGKAGMVAIDADTFQKLDLVEILAFMNASLPKYAIPLFLRILPNFDLTGSFKIIKRKLKSEGYNLEKTEDPLYFLHPIKKKYIKLDETVYHNLRSGNIKL